MEDILVIRCPDILNNIFSLNSNNPKNRVSRFLKSKIYIDDLTTDKNLKILNQFIIENKPILIEIDPAYLFNSNLSNPIFVDLLELSKHLELLLNYKNCHLVVNFLREQTPHDEYIIPVLKIINKYPKLKNRIWYFTNFDVTNEITRVSKLINLPYQGINCVTINYFEVDCYLNCINADQRNSNIKKEKLFLSLNTKPEKINRLNLALFLYKNGLLDRGYFSLKKMNNYDTNIANQNIFNEFQNEYNNFIKIWNKYTINQDEEKITKSIDTNGTFSGYPYPVNLYDKSYISIISETHFDLNRTVFLTEKTYRTLFYEHPFIMLGPPASLKELKSLGYTTFNPIINEEYDDEEDNYSRLNTALINLKNNRESIIYKYNELINICSYNKSVLTKNAEQTIDNINNIFGIIL